MYQKERTKREEEKDWMYDVNRRTRVWEAEGESWELPSRGVTMEGHVVRASPKVLSALSQARRPLRS